MATLRFTANEDFKHGPVTFEAGNTYTAEKYGLTEAEVSAFWDAGWAEVEGWDKAPARQPTGVTVRAQDTTHKQGA